MVDMATSQNFNLSAGVKGHTLGTRLKYPKSANNRALLTARIYPQLPRLSPDKHVDVLENTIT